MTDSTWWQLLLALGYGVLGSDIPIVNAEAFIVASVATAMINPVVVGLLLGLGHGIGKMALFQTVRQGRRRLFRKRPPKESSPTGQGIWRARWDRVVGWSIRLVEHPRWGPVGFFLSGLISLPPNYLTTIIAATTRINFALFSVFLTAGFISRYVLIALAAAGVVDRIL